MICIPTDNRNTFSINRNVDHFLNNQVATFYENRQNKMDRIDKNISHLDDTLSNNIIKGDIFTFATHNIRGINDSTDPIKSS